MLQMSLLVITPTLGNSPHLGEAMADVGGLAALVPLQHVVVAPGERAMELRQRWPAAAVVAEAGGGGVYGAINSGAAAGENWRWLTWLNDDDRLQPGFAALWRRAQAAPEAADVWYGEVDYIDEAGATIARLPLCRRPEDVPALLAAGLAPFTQQGTLISAALWRRLGGINPALCIAGDFDFWVRAAAAGARFASVPETVASFRVRSGQLSGDVSLARAEVATVLGRGELRIGALARLWAVVWFRMHNAPRVLRRIARTGRLRSRGMFAR